MARVWGQGVCAGRWGRCFRRELPPPGCGGESPCWERHFAMGGGVDPGRSVGAVESWAVAGVAWAVVVVAAAGAVVWGRSAAVGGRRRRVEAVAAGIRRRLARGTVTPYQAAGLTSVPVVEVAVWLLLKRGRVLGAAAGGRVMGAAVEATGAEAAVVGAGVVAAEGDGGLRVRPSACSDSAPCDARHEAGPSGRRDAAYPPGVRRHGLSGGREVRRVRTAGAPGGRG